MKPRDHQEEMDMPTPCESCGRWQELNDMCPSDKWYPGIVICERCSKLEEDEVDMDQSIEACNEAIDDAEYTIKEQKEYKEQLLRKQANIQERIDEWRNEQ